jgi:NADPH-dependent curcumin reductase CurA
VGGRRRDERCHCRRSRRERARFEQATDQLATWVTSGDLTHSETIDEGLENAPDAFLGLFSGDNIGKQVVAVAT